ncbi:3734_t:CDS:2, partial [Gigaspora margarita]
EQAIKCINPAHQTKSEVETLFDDRLTEVIKAENEKTKFFNDALWQKKCTQNLQTSYRGRGFQPNSGNKRNYQHGGSNMCRKVNNHGGKLQIFARLILPLNRTSRNAYWGMTESVLHERQALLRQNISSQDMEILDVEMKKLLVQGTITEIFLSEPCFTSRLFLIPKRTGEACPVIDLRKLNT